MRSIACLTAAILRGDEIFISYCLKVSSLLQLIVLYINGTLQLVFEYRLIDGERCKRTTTHYCFSNRDVGTN